jgi:hypothetical protein
VLSLFAAEILVPVSAFSCSLPLWTGWDSATLLVRPLLRNQRLDALLGIAAKLYYQPFAPRKWSAP